MRKMMVLAAMLAMMLVASSPAMADEIEIDNDDGVVSTSEVSGDEDFEDFVDEDEEVFLISEDFDFDEEDFEEDDFDFVTFESVDSDFDRFEF